MPQEGILQSIYELCIYNLIAGIKWSIFEKPGIWMHLILVGFVKEFIEICEQMF